MSRCEICLRDHGQSRGEQAFDLARLCQYFSELSPQPMVAVEGATHIVRHLNAAFSRLVGKEATELIGRPFAEAVPEGEDNKCLSLFDRVYRTGTPEILDEQEHSHTPPMYWSYSVWAILGADDRPVGVMVQVTDATEVAIFRKQAVAMNEQLLLSSTRQHELTENAERANQLKDESLATLSHEIAERTRAEAELMKLNEQLEQRVAMRTGELTEINFSLQSEISERRRAERERASILRRLVMAEESERGRIARDMHDQFGQQLTVLQMKLDALYRECAENENLCEQVETLQSVARQLDADVEHMVWEMRPTALDDLGLESALSSYVKKWSQHIAVAVQLHTTGMEKDRLMPEIETTLYRIAQEALNNIAKHAAAKSVAVVLERRASQVSLIIEDDGIGFDLQQAFGANDKKLGLIGMRERAALVGGTVEIESQPNEGTTVVARVVVPLVGETGATNETGATDG